MNPLAQVSETGATGYIDVAFEVTSRGGTRRVRITDMSAGVSAGDIRELKRLLTINSGRPRMVDGKVVAYAPVSLRHYVKRGVGVAEVRVLLTGATSYRFAPDRRQRLRLLQHHLHSCILQIGRIAIFAEDTFDQYTQPCARRFAMRPIHRHILSQAHQ